MYLLRELKEKRNELFVEFSKEKPYYEKEKDCDTFLNFIKGRKSEAVPERMHDLYTIAERFAIVLKDDYDPEFQIKLAARASN